MTAKPPSHVYYFEVGAGTWRGTFTFRVTSWRAARRASIGLKNLLLVVTMQATQRIAGPSRFLSVVAAHPYEGEFGVADNRVELSALGLRLYDLRERYLLSPDGQGVKVFAHEHFGPVPVILTRQFEYPAEIRSDGLGSTYHMPLLGSPWTATYAVGDDRRSLAGTLVCDWAQADERATRDSRGT